MTPGSSSPPKENNFQCATEIIRSYKRISGASLNLNKSIVIPLYLSDPIPRWLVEASCKVAEIQEVITYLGCPIEHDITPSMEAAFLPGKVRKCLNHWANKVLSWDDKVILLKHVLRNIPTYHLLIFSLNKKGYDDLEQICRRFLWGSNPNGNGKKALIAWKEITWKKSEGGLDIRSFEDQTLALKMRCVSQILSSRQSEWVIIANSFIKATFCVGPEKKEWKGWS